MDLDGPEYADREAVRDHAENILLDGRANSPYRALEQRAGRVADAVAGRARDSFLIARLTALSLVTRDRPASAQERFPDSVAGAMEDLLTTAGDPRRTTDLLRPLAHARGTGLPQTLWTSLAGVLAGQDDADRREDVVGLVNGPLAALVTASPARAGARCYRLFHEALDDCVSAIPPANPDAPRTAAESEEAIARTLDRIRRDGRADEITDRYVRTHLGAHAVNTPLLDELLLNPGFLLAAARDDLLDALRRHRATNPATRASKAAYELAAHHLRPDVPHDERAARLAMSAARESSPRAAR